MMRALIVDDEPHAREELEALLRETGAFAVVGSCANAIQGLRTLRSTRPDVLFLDIHMPKVDGFQMLAMIEPEILPIVVFVTAYDEHALRAFERDAADYLLKPVQPERLARTVEKLKRYLGTGERPKYAGTPLERVPCVGAHSIRLIDLADVEFVRSGETGVHVVTARGEFLTELTLTVLEAKAARFVRCHKQFLVNLAQVDEVLRPDPSTTLLRTKSGRQVPVSRRFLAPLKELLGI